MICLLAKVNYTEMRRSLLVSTKIGIGFLFLIHFGGTLTTCNENIPHCDKHLTELKRDVMDWQERCLNKTGHEINSSCCQAEKDYLQERMRKHTEMCFYSGKLIFDVPFKIRIWEADKGIVNRDIVWKMGKLQSAYNELRFNVETASPCTNLLKFCWLIFQKCGWVIQQCDATGRLRHYTKNSSSSPCKSQHKHEQKDKTKTLVKFSDYVFIDFDRGEMMRSQNIQMRGDISIINFHLVGGVTYLKGYIYYAPYKQHMITWLETQVI